MAYVCKIASMEEMERKWNAEILRNIDEKDNWVAWKAEAMENEINHCSITCYGRTMKAWLTIRLLTCVRFERWKSIGGKDFSLNF